MTILASLQIGLRRLREMRSQYQAGSQIEIGWQDWLSI
jgi:hypothetical protein